MTNQPEKFDLTSHDIADEKQQELLRLFPEIRTEGGKLDFERLKLALGEAVDTGKERYGMNWPGKADCFKTIQAPSMGTLRPCPEESVNFDTSENLIIEGDNLEVLKLLQKSYLGKVKMIYIDPPYNTGNDFIYPDNYSESLQTYLEYTGQVDAEGRKFGTNTDTDGRFHSKWLNMMYPRLYLARNLLREDGIIFISIDDCEVENLRRLCNEVFGEEAFIAQFVWKSRVSEDTRAKTGVSNDHEYVVCYGAIESQALRGSQKDLAKFDNPDGDERGPWRSADLTGLATKDARPNLHYNLVDPETGINYGCPPKGWRYDPKTMARKISEKRILWPADSAGRPRHKLFLNEMESHFKNLSSVLLNTNTAQGTRELIELLGSDIVSFPKPTALMRLVIEQVANNDDIILDFFAGSGTTAHAVLDLNRQDGGNRKFILVQLPEPTGREDYPTIADITKERVRRVIQTISRGDAEKNAKTEKNEMNLSLELPPTSSLPTPSSAPSASPRDPDLGFRVFKLDTSNFKPWNAQLPHDAQALEQQLELHIDHICDDRTASDLLYELLLKSGSPLTTPTEPIGLADQTVYSVAGGALLICLERELTLELIRAMADLKPERIVCLDEGFAGNDQLKANAVQIFKTNGITSFKTV